MSVCSVVIGRVIAACVQNGMTLDEAMAMARQAQQAMHDGAGISTDAPDSTKH
jgi:predicted RNase H-like HicB family nuclease